MTVRFWKTNQWVAFAAGGALSVLTMVQTEASAATKVTTESPFHCMAVPDTGCVKGGNLLYNSCTSELKLYCSVQDDDSFAKTEIATWMLAVDDRHTDAAVRARACASYYAIRGGECGDTEFSGSGETAIFLTGSDLTPLKLGGDFGYVQVVIPGAIGSTRSALKGIMSWN